MEQLPDDNKEGIGAIWEENFEHPRIIKTPTGELVCGIDIGVGRERQEDALVIHSQKDAFAVIDGMGGMGMGDKAALILAQTLKSGFQNETPLPDIQREASMRMQRAGVRSGGACYTALRIRNNHLYVGYAGDVQLIVINKKGELVHEQKPEGYGNIVYNAVTGNEAGKTSTDLIELKQGHRVLVASDGLWGNLPPSAVAHEIHDVPIDTALRHIAERALHNMKDKAGDPHPDNLSILIYEAQNI